MSGEWATAVSALQLADRLVDAIQRGVDAAGHPGVRPLHGFVFVRVSAGDATIADVAIHLGVTKQAAAQVVDRLFRDGYIERVPHPADHRARLLRLTASGWRVTEVAMAAAEAEVARWRAELGVTAPAFEAGLGALTAGRTTVRPARR